MTEYRSSNVSVTLDSWDLTLVFAAFAKRNIAILALTGLQGAFSFDNSRYKSKSLLFEYNAQKENSDSSTALIKLDFRIKSLFLRPLKITSSLSGTYSGMDLCIRSLKKKTHSWVCKC